MFHGTSDLEGVLTCGGVMKKPVRPLQKDCDGFCVCFKSDILKAVEYARPVKLLEDAAWHMVLEFESCCWKSAGNKRSWRLQACSKYKLVGVWCLPEEPLKGIIKPCWHDVESLRSKQKMVAPGNNL